MISKKVKCISLLIISLFIINVHNVYAGKADGNAAVGTTTSRVDAQGTCPFKYVINGQEVCHHDYDIKINYGGVEYTGYCADFNVALDTYYNQQTGMLNTNNYHCTVEENSKIYSALSADGYSQSQKTAALRNITEGLVTNDQTVQDLLNGVGGANSIVLTKIGESKNSVTYSINTSLDMSKVSFTCGAGCSNVSVSGKVLTVTLQNGACSFAFSAKYAGNTTNTNTGGTINTTTTNGKVLKCTNDAGQTVYGVYEDSSTTTKPNESTTPGVITQNFSGTLTNCGEEPNKCKEQTQFNVPTYCDDAGEEKITIKAPNDVKYCILNGKDEAGNTYKMTGQGLDNNPYCAVFCKEDYEITMPGATYSDSGRYFELQNTVVKAKRTCYATNPKGNSDDPAIDIEQFIADVRSKQQELIEAKEAYLKAKATEQAPIETHTESDCDGTYEWFTKDSVSYTGVELGNCDAQTGVCQFRNATHSTESYRWGTSSNKHTEQSTSPQNYGEEICVGDRNTTEAPDFASMRANAEGRLNEIQNQLRTMIDHMEKCYSWVNNLCLDTLVNFDYNEQYSTNINYELVAGGGTFVGKNATYKSGSKTIDNNYTANENASLESPGYVFCNTEICNYSNVAKDISTLRNKLYFRKIEVDGSAEYANTQAFQTNYPSGTIDTVADPSAIRYNYSYLGTVFPVALNTPTGVYNWTLNFSKLGQYNEGESCRNGRLDEVAKALNKSTSAGLQYVCVYVVDCPDCDYECLDPSGNNCIIPDPKPQCPDCDVYCENCIFDGDESTFFFRIIGSDTNPNDRGLGNNLTNAKGEETLKAIESAGENIYKEPEYTFVIDALKMQAIRKHNRETGTYIEQNLNYGAVNGVGNIAGYSSFLRDGNNGVNKKYFVSGTLNNDWTLWSGDTDANTGPAWK